MNNELLSAYLDDELSLPERAEVERLLASEIDAQRSLHELRAVRRAVKCLPTERAPATLTASVAQRLQTLRATPRAVAGTRHGLNTRRWAWPLAAIAAAVAIGFFGVQQNPAPNGSEVAQVAPAPEPFTAGPDVAGLLKDLPSKAASLVSDDERTLVVRVPGDAASRAHLAKLVAQTPGLKTSTAVTDDSEVLEAKPQALVTLLGKLRDDQQHFAEVHVEARSPLFAANDQLPDWRLFSRGGVPVGAAVSATPPDTATITAPANAEPIRVLLLFDQAK